MKCRTVKELSIGVKTKQILLNWKEFSWLKQSRINGEQLTVRIGTCQSENTPLYPLIGFFLCWSSLNFVRRVRGNREKVEILRPAIGSWGRTWRRSPSTDVWFIPLLFLTGTWLFDDLPRQRVSLLILFRFKVDAFFSACSPSGQCQIPSCGHVKVNWRLSGFF